MRFAALEAQVDTLMKALAEQAAAQAALQEKLVAALSENAELRAKLRAAKSKRSRSAAADTADSVPAESASDEEELSPSRRSSGRSSPTNV